MYKKIRRKQADGSWVVVEVPANYVLQAGEELVSGQQPEPPQPNQPNPNQPQNPPANPGQPNPSQPQVPPNAPAPPGQDQPLTAAAVQQMVHAARAEERARFEQQLAADRQAREALQNQLNAIQEERRQAELNGLPADQRQAREVQDTLRRFEQQQQQSQQMILGLQAQLRATELAAYRERVLRQYGAAVVPDLVTGNSEQELDAAAARAAQTYQFMRQQIEQDFAQRFGINPNQTPVNPGLPQVVLPNQQTPPPVVLPDGTNGLPSPVNPGTQGSELGQPQFNLSEVTTEQAVRSGRWGGELRDQVLQNLRAQGIQQGNPLGVSPRWQQPTGQQVLPGGAVAPVAAPMIPSVPAYQQDTRGVQGVQGSLPPGVQDPRQQQAREAIARTYNGQNPIIQSLPAQQQTAVNAGVRDIQGQVQQGLDSNQLYQQRFQSAPLH